MCITLCPDQLETVVGVVDMSFCRSYLGDDFPIFKFENTRIPIYSDHRNNIIGLLFAADLALLKRDEKVTIDTFLKNHRHRRHMVTEETTLRTIIDEFDKVDDSGIFVVQTYVFLQNDFRMAIVIRKIDQMNGTPYYETTGIVTLTDIMEEICHAEINFAHRN